MHIIPVLDIKAGMVVHASGGDRERYRPVLTPLAATADPADVTRGLLAYFPFDTLYVADLDGIAGRGRNHDTICALSREFPALALWVDDGSATADAVARLAAMPAVSPVVGSETLARASDLAAIRDRLGEDRYLLSLDFKGDAFLGPPHLLDDPAAWPPTVVAMTLAAVGAGRGPDLARVRKLRSAKPGGRIIAAGGVRDARDLEALAGAGAAGVLVATALHRRTIKAGDLERAAGL